MPEDNRRDVEVVRRLLEAVQAGAPESAMELLHPDVRFDATVRPDGRLWHGRQGARQAMSEWVDEWDEYEMQLERYLPAGEGRVAVLWHERGRARGSGVPIAQSGITVFTLRDGLVAEIRPRLDRERALEELGLTDA
jgi:ketosteroid isomerase-like protein